LDEPDDRGEGLAVGTIREHAGLGEVLQEVRQLIRTMPNRDDPPVHDKRHVYREAGNAAEILEDGSPLVMEGLPQRLGRSSRGQCGDGRSDQDHRRGEPKLG
jgi:hypothetical protein